MDARPDVMLLAAGLGTRLRPLTETRPKPLVEVAGMALVDRVIGAARAEGLTRFVINAHHHAGQLRAHAEALRRDGLDIVVSDESDGLLDTGGGVRRALPLLRTDPVLVMNTDAFWRPGEDAPLARLLAQADAVPGSVVLLCARPALASGFRRSHDFCLDPNRRVTDDSGAPVIYAGVALIPRADIDALPAGPVSLLEVFAAARAEHRLYGVPLLAPWLHVGDPQGLAEAEARLEGSA